MNKKLISVIIIIFILIIVLIIIRSTKSINNNENSNVSVMRSEYNIEEEEGNFILYDDIGQEIIRAGDKGAFEIYIRDKDYNPQIPIKESGISESDFAIYEGEQ